LTVFLLIKNSRSFHSFVSVNQIKSPSICWRINYYDTPDVQEPLVVSETSLMKAFNSDTGMIFSGATWNWDFFDGVADGFIPQEKSFHARGKAETSLSGLTRVRQAAQYIRWCRSRYIGRTARAIDKDAVARCSIRTAARSMPSVASRLRFSILSSAGRTPTRDCQRITVVGRLWQILAHLH